MHVDRAVDLMQVSLMTTAMLVGPFLAVVFVVSLVVNLAQALTQLQDQSLTIIPKLLAAAAAAFWLLPWVLHNLMVFSSDMLLSAGRQ